MLGLGGMGGTPSAPKRFENISIELKIANELNLNACRMVTSLIGGIGAGILGLTGWTGFLFYFVLALIVSLLVAAKGNFQLELYFVDTSAIFSHGLFYGVLTFIMFWTLSYDVVHVYT
eukprot:TRINITY_DN2579_c0_g1_i1.p1 TRINITY_DN2579_c0_g1~~TRINITY_DN2579_c0_g1_i1.p1  ORF type:complete len:118 (-),score=12.76 TRINITY_DN2579_c0_g1_i1:38-391(-)